MSTVIYHAYRFKANRASAVEKNNTYIREIIEKKLKSSIFKKMTTDFIEYKFHLAAQKKESSFDNFYDYLELNNFQTPPEQLKYLRNTVQKHFYSNVKFYKMFAELSVEAVRYNFNTKFNHKVTVYFRTLGGYTYYLFTSQDSDLLNDFRRDFETYMPENFKSYDYWNNTDGPDDITYAAWSGRGRKWDKVFSSNPADDMNKIDITFELYYLMDFQRCIEYFPEDFDLFKLYYNELKSEDYFVEENDKIIKETGKKNDNKAYRHTVARIKADFESKVAFEEYASFLESEFTKEKLMNALYFEQVLTAGNENSDDDD